MGTSRSATLQRHLAQRTLAGLQFRGDERVLDVGCGDGFITRSIAARLTDGAVVGVDASPRMIEVARSRPDPDGADLRFEVCDVLALPFAAEFDLVVSFNVLHWVVEQQAALTSIAGVDGGRRSGDRATGVRRTPAQPGTTRDAGLRRPRWSGCVRRLRGALRARRPADLPGPRRVGWIAGDGAAGAGRGVGFRLPGGVHPMVHRRVRRLDRAAGGR